MNTLVDAFHQFRLPDQIHTLRKKVCNLVHRILENGDRLLYLGCLSAGPLLGVGAGVCSQDFQIGVTSSIIGCIPSMLIWLPSSLDKNLR